MMLGQWIVNKSRELVSSLGIKNKSDWESLLIPGLNIGEIGLLFITNTRFQGN